MNVQRIASVLLVAGAIVMTGAFTATGQNQAGGQGLQVGVVHLQQLMDNLRAVNTLRTELQQRRDRIQAEAERRQSELQGMENQHALLTPGTAEWRDKAVEMEEKSAELQTWVSYEQVQLARFEIQGMERVYREVLAAVQTLANDEGLDLILVREGEFRLPEAPPGAEQQLAQELRQQISLRKVLFAHDRLDVTNAVRERMDRDIREGR